jgi:hypothetical protein
MKESDVINRLTNAEKDLLEEILHKEKAKLNLVNMESNKSEEKNLVDEIYVLIKGKVKNEA